MVAGRSCGAHLQSTHLAGVFAMRALDLARFAIALRIPSPQSHTPRNRRVTSRASYMMTDYPAVTVRPGTTSNIPLRLQNYGLGTRAYRLSVSGVPSGWTATLLGGGQPVAAAMPAPDTSVSASASRSMFRRTVGMKRADADGEGGGAGHAGELADRRGARQGTARQAHRHHPSSRRFAAARSRTSNIR